MSIRKSHRRRYPLTLQRQAGPVKPFEFKERENPFSNNVLIGNWFEERFDNRVDRKAITPGIYGESKCPQENTLYMKDFQQPILKGDKEKYQEFANWKQQGFRNRLNEQQTNLLIWDDDQFHNNLTTLNDIMYRMKPKENAMSADGLLAKRKIAEDHMRSYGNSTKTGLLHWMACERQWENERPIDVSHYKNNFKPIKMTEKRILHKATQRKTSI